MHVLTKIFIVLVSLLAILLVPLVVVYAHNENSFKARYQDADAASQTAKSNLEAANAGHMREMQRVQSELEQTQAEKKELSRANSDMQGKVTELQTGLAESKAQQAKLGTRDLLIAVARVLASDQATVVESIRVRDWTANGSEARRMLGTPSDSPARRGPAFTRTSSAPRSRRWTRRRVSGRAIPSPAAGRSSCHHARPRSSPRRTRPA